MGKIRVSGKKFRVGGKNIFQMFCVLSQNFCVPSRNFAFSRKDICVPSQNFCVLSQIYIYFFTFCEGTQISLRGNAKFLERTQKFCRERKVSRGNAKVLQENAKHLKNIFSSHPDFFPLTLIFSHHNVL